MVGGGPVDVMVPHERLAFAVFFVLVDDGQLGQFVHGKIGVYPAGQPGPDGRDIVQDVLHVIAGAHRLDDGDETVLYPGREHVHGRRLLDDRHVHPREEAGEEIGQLGIGITGRAPVRAVEVHGLEDFLSGGGVRIGHARGQGGVESKDAHQFLGKSSKWTRSSNVLSLTSVSLSQSPPQRMRWLTRPNASSSSATPLTTPAK